VYSGFVVPYRDYGSAIDPMRSAFGAKIGNKVYGYSLPGYDDRELDGYVVGAVYGGSEQVELSYYAGTVVTDYAASPYAEYELNRLSIRPFEHTGRKEI